MNKVTLDRSAVAQLRQLTEGAELCDNQGHVVGFLTPALDRSHYVGVDSPVPEEELRRRAERQAGRTLSEIMADLEKLA